MNSLFNDALNLDTDVRFRDVHVDAMAREVTVAGRTINLTRTEYALLVMFVDHPRRALSRAQILNLVWGDQWYGDDHLVSVHVSNLRRKIGDGQRMSPMIRTLHGFGYRFDG